MRCCSGVETGRVCLRALFCAAVRALPVFAVRHWPAAHCVFAFDLLMRRAAFWLRARLLLSCAAASRSRSFSLRGQLPLQLGLAAATAFSLGPFVLCPAIPLCPGMGAAMDSMPLSPAASLATSVPLMRQRGR